MFERFLGTRDDEFDDYEDDYEEQPKKVKDIRDIKKGHVIVVKPKGIEDAKPIADNLLEGSAVVINLIGLETEKAQRIIDFISGSCYCINGNLQKINEQMIIVTPKKIMLSGDFLEESKK